MNKKTYTIPSIEVVNIESEELLQSLGFGGIGSTDASSESKQNSFFASFDSYDSDDDWGDIWADETEEY